MASVTEELDGILEESQGESTEGKKAAGGFGAIGSIVLVVILLVAGVFLFALMNRGQSQPRSGPAPDFTMTTFGGEEIRLSELQGNVVVLNFWAGWCGPCRSEAPALEAAWQKYKEQGVVFLGVAWTDTERSAKAFIEEFGVTYPTGLDIRTKISEQYRITGIPETFIIDRNGEIVNFIPMPLTEAQLTTYIENALNRG